MYSRLQFQLTKYNNMTKFNFSLFSLTIKPLVDSNVIVVDMTV